MLTENAKSPADITVADDWCIKLPDGYVYSTYEDEDDGLLLTIGTVADLQSRHILVQAMTPHHPLPYQAIHLIMHLKRKKVVTLQQPFMVRIMRRK